MRPNMIVVSTPLLDDNLGFFQRIEKLPVKEFIPEPAIEAFVIAVLPRTAGFYIGSFDT